MYLLFAGVPYYPHGGARDFKTKGTLEECKAWFEDPANRMPKSEWQSPKEMWCDIVDAETMQIVVIGEGTIKGSVLNDEPVSLGPVKWRTPDWRDDPEDDR